MHQCVNSTSIFTKALIMCGACWLPSTPPPPPLAERRTTMTMATTTNERTKLTNKRMNDGTNERTNERRSKRPRKRGEKDGLDENGKISASEEGRRHIQDDTQWSRKSIEFDH
ncbi:hypothetical protein BLOT_003709 [Blomia tropicalis]|nr:hypothetical protein BLOT_003709 [Blomia tropicalis]